MNPLLLSSLLEIGKNIIGKVWPDPVQQAEAQLRFAQMQQTGELKGLEADLQLALAQVDLNKAEAQGNWFQRGWRPNIGWVCGIGLGYQIIFRPIANGLLVVNHYPPAFPEIDINTLMTLIPVLLGVAGMRTLERVKGKA